MAWLNLFFIVFLFACPLSNAYAGQNAFYGGGWLNEKLGDRIPAAPADGPGRSHAAPAGDPEPGQQCRQVHRAGFGLAVGGGRQKRGRDRGQRLRVGDPGRGAGAAEGGGNRSARGDQHQILRNRKRSLRCRTANGPRAGVRLIHLEEGDLVASAIRTAEREEEGKSSPVATAPDEDEEPGVGTSHAPSLHGSGA